MNRAATPLLVSFASLALAASAVAQHSPAITALRSSPNSATVPANQTIILEGNPGGSCPIGLRAHPGVGPGMVIVVDSSNTASQKLDLQLSNPDNEGVITHAKITVHGLTARGRISPATDGGEDTATIAKEVDLALNVAPGSDAFTTMLFQGLTSVRWIDLNSLAYADGSSWHASPQHTCQITPDRTMLVASH